MPTNNYSQNERGLIKVLLIIITAILLLTYFHIDLRGFFLAHPPGQILGQIWVWLKSQWPNLTKTK